MDSKLQKEAFLNGMLDELSKIAFSVAKSVTTAAKASKVPVPNTLTVKKPASQSTLPKVTSKPVIKEKLSPGEVHDPMARIRANPSPPVTVSGV